MAERQKRKHKETGYAETCHAIGLSESEGDIVIQE